MKLGNKSKVVETNKQKESKVVIFDLLLPVVFHDRLLIEAYILKV